MTLWVGFAFVAGLLIGLINGLWIGDRIHAATVRAMIRRGELIDQRPRVEVGHPPTGETCDRCGVPIGRHWVDLPEIERVCLACWMTSRDEA